jgi:hypothetical protein
VKVAFGLGGPLANDAPASSHDPGAFYTEQTTFGWCTFDSASVDVNAIMEECFCGRKGRRTIFTIEGVFCIFIKAFSEFPREAEVLFPPTARFKVRAVNKRLLPYASPTRYPIESQEMLR